MDQNIIKTVGESLDMDFIDMVISNSRNMSEISKVKIRPVSLKGKTVFQAAEYRGKQIFHINCTKEELLDRLPAWLDGLMRQVQIRTQGKQITVMISKKGKVTIKSKRTGLTENAQTKNAAADQDRMNHNREKSYLLPEGKPVPFLIDLGVMTAEGKVVKAKYDKYRQINRFLEFIADVLPVFDKDKMLTIIDFGCGKSYLTFAMYYYLNELMGYKIQVTGLDLKKEVIDNCNRLARYYGYERLNFLEGDIASYNGADKADMVVTLHACDTATDYALFKAILWDTEVILSVPCCQHELNSRIDCGILGPMLRYGLIKERFAALATDALRAELLEAVGYKTQILEFIDMEHTPKNILIRAVKRHDRNSRLPDKEHTVHNIVISPDKLASYKTCSSFLKAEPALYQLLSEHYPLSLQ